MDSQKEEQTFLKFHFKSKLKKVTLFKDQLCLNLEKQYIVSALTSLRTHQSLRYTQLLDVCATDYLGKRKQRFEIVYHLLSMHFNQRLRIKVPLAEGENMPSVASVFASANWWEREVYDMFGIHFDNHPNMKRILTDYSFQGHPLCKDFPVMGYVQVRYDQEKKAVIEEPVHLEQAYRTFETLSPWQGMHSALLESCNAQKTGKAT